MLIYSEFTKTVVNVDAFKVVHVTEIREERKPDLHAVIASNVGKNGWWTRGDLIEAVTKGDIEILFVSKDKEKINNLYIDFIANVKASNPAFYNLI